jgi:hypothetical protein
MERSVAFTLSADESPEVHSFDTDDVNSALEQYEGAVESINGAAEPCQGDSEKLVGAAIIQDAEGRYRVTMSPWTVYSGSGVAWWADVRGGLTHFFRNLTESDVVIINFQSDLVQGETDIWDMGRLASQANALLTTKASITVEINQPTSGIMAFLVACAGHVTCGTHGTLSFSAPAEILSPNLEALSYRPFFERVIAANLVAKGILTAEERDTLLMGGREPIYVSPQELAARLSAG